MATNEKTAKDKPDNKPVAKDAEHKTNGQTIAITILATALTCFVIVFAVLLCTGVMKFGGGEDDEVPGQTQKPIVTRPDDTTSKKDTGELVDNPYKRVAVNGTLVEVDNLEFYLPNEFKAGGKNKDGAYTYNLVDDDGWAQVLVYAERSTLTPTKYLNKISSYLDITDTGYKINGTSWVQGENANALAYATKLDGKIYAVYYSVKLDSDATGKAMQMIPKTLYMKKIEQE